MAEDKVIDSLVEYLTSNDFEDGVEDISIFNAWTTHTKIKIENEDTVIRCLRLIGDRAFIKNSLSP